MSKIERIDRLSARPEPHLALPARGEPNAMQSGSKPLALHRETSKTPPAAPAGVNSALMSTSACNASG
jgi:hypothetical protein